MIQIVKWSETFEGAPSRRPRRMTWYAHPTELHSRGAVELRSLGTDGLVAYSVFTFFCQISAKLESGKRGLLCHTNGKPMSIAYLASTLSLDRQLIEGAIEILFEIGWLEDIETNVNPDTEQDSEPDLKLLDQKTSNDVRDLKPPEHDLKPLDQKASNDVRDLKPPDRKCALQERRGEERTEQNKTGEDTNTTEQVRAFAINWDQFKTQRFTTNEFREALEAWSLARDKAGYGPLDEPLLQSIFYQIGQRDHIDDALALRLIWDAASGGWKGLMFRDVDKHQAIAVSREKQAKPTASISEVLQRRKAGEI